MAKFTVKGRKIKVHKPDTMQKILIMVNFLLFVVGIAILLFGIATQSPPLFKKFLNFMTKKGVKIPPPMVKVIQTMMKDFSKLGVFVTLVGIIISVVSFTGCAGACCSKKLLKYYKYAMMAIILIIIIIGYAVHKNARTATPVIVKALAKFFGNFDKPTAKKMIHVMQMSGKCCGATSPDEWSDSTDFTATVPSGDVYSIVQGVNGSYPIGDNPVPDSCCVKPTRNCGLINNQTYIDEFDKVMAESFNEQEVKDLKDNYDEWREEEFSEKDMEDFYGSGDWEDCDPSDKACNKEFYSDDGDINFDEIKEGDFDGKDEYYDTYYKGEKSTQRLTGRFANDVSPDPPKGIWPLGCGVKFGSLIQKSRKNIPYIVILFLIPELVAIYMATKVAKYFKKTEELEDG